VFVSVIAVTKKFSPVRELRITSPTVKICAGLEPEPVTSIDVTAAAVVRATRE
jgi:hypothetical protein